jgi:hypothetical protein
VNRPPLHVRESDTERRHAFLAGEGTLTGEEIVRWANELRPELLVAPTLGNVYMVADNGPAPTELEPCPKCGTTEPECPRLDACPYDA